MRELQSLADAVGLDPPLVEEVAAAGERFEASGRCAVGGRGALRFMGWATRES